MGLVVVVLIAVSVGVYYTRKSVNHGLAKAMYGKTNARALDEIWTTLTYTAPADPVAVQRAVTERLVLSTDPPVAFVAKTFLVADKPGSLVVAFGNKAQRQGVGSASFQAAEGGGTVGRWTVGSRTTHDGVVHAQSVIDAMTTVRSGTAAAVADTGGSSTVRMAPPNERVKR